jgi:hypothetical protein
MRSALGCSFLSLLHVITLIERDALLFASAHCLLYFHFGLHLTPQLRTSAIGGAGNETSCQYQQPTAFPLFPRIVYTLVLFHMGRGDQTFLMNSQVDVLMDPYNSYTI